MTDIAHRSLAKLGEWEGDEPHYSSLFFSTWVGFVFLWRSWLLIETKYGMHTEFTRRISSMDLVISHLGCTAFFIPMRFLHHAPPNIYWGVMIPCLVIYIITWYLAMALMKLSQSIFLQMVAMLMLFCYFAVYFAAGTLGQMIVESGMPHGWWMGLQFFVLIGICCKERFRVSRSDPLDYNYTKAQREKERVWGGRAGGSVDRGGGGVKNTVRGGAGTSAGAMRMEEGRKAKAMRVGGGSKTGGGSGGRPTSYKKGSGGGRKAGGIY
ncbi:hypothetical protein TrLO_g8519 [Triparma laevis f. longispina]|uniref:Uncharacterized protein n=1 Tax=Triparma laevis f. longispina TaxID=1714387 RepID=A0A9W7C3D8_9STRA|nr:hypothetical protein TrLO_g8519 [Triparma laevis f. longispina]